MGRRVYRGPGRHRRGRRFFHRCGETWLFVTVALLAAFFLALLYPLGLLMLLLGAIIAAVVFVILQK